jgi:hypothetical protein
MNLELIATHLYRRKIRDYLPTDPLIRQRVKLLLFNLWFYYPLLTHPILLSRLIRAQWFVRQDTRPIETRHVLKEILRRRPWQQGEIIVECGCFQGGTTSQFSLACALMRYPLHIYDSFQGVPEWNYKFACAQDVTEHNVTQYGDITVCTFHPGWFADTLLDKPIPYPVRLAYIDCDSAAGTMQALSGILPSLVSDAVVFTQDFHIAPVRALLEDPGTWQQLGAPIPKITQLTHKLAIIGFASLIAQPKEFRFRPPTPL